MKSPVVPIYASIFICFYFVWFSSIFSAQIAKGLNTIFDWNTFGASSYDVKFNQDSFLVTEFPSIKVFNQIR